MPPRNESSGSHSGGKELPAAATASSKRIVVISNHDSSSSAGNKLRVVENEVQPIFKIERVPSNSNSGTSNESSGAKGSDLA